MLTTYSRVLDERWLLEGAELGVGLGQEEEEADSNCQQVVIFHRNYALTSKRIMINFAINLIRCHVNRLCHFM